MTTDYKGARDEMLGAFTTAWNSGSSAIVGYIPEIRFDGDNKSDIPDASKFWVRISTQGINCEQGTLSENVVTNGSRRYESYGLMYAQLFAPKANDSKAKILNLAKLVQKTFRKRTLNVILRNARIEELEPENGIQRINVVCEFEFDEIN